MSSSASSRNTSHISTNPWQKYKFHGKLFNRSRRYHSYIFIHGVIMLELPKVRIWTPKTYTSWRQCWSEGWVILQMLPFPQSFRSLEALPGAWGMESRTRPYDESHSVQSPHQIKGPLCKLHTYQLGGGQQGRLWQTPMVHVPVLKIIEEFRNQRRKHFYKEILLHNFCIQ